MKSTKILFNLIKLSKKYKVPYNKLMDLYIKKNNLKNINFF